MPCSRGTNVHLVNARSSPSALQWLADSSERFLKGESNTMNGTEKQKRQALGQKTEEMQAILATAKSEHRDLNDGECARFDVLDVEVTQLAHALGIEYEGQSREQRVQKLDAHLSQIVNPHRV